MASESPPDAPRAPPDLVRVVTGSGAETPVVRISGRFVQDLSARPGDPRTFATAGAFIAEVRRQFRAKVRALEGALIEKGVFAGFPYLISDMLDAIARARLHDADGDHLPPETSGAVLADLIGQVDVLYVCVDH